MPEYIERGKRFIDANKLYDFIQKEKAWRQDRMRQPRYGQGKYDAYYEMLDIINEQPTADVQEVKHGEWKAEGDCGITRCSVCGWTIEEDIEDNYCRNCGAKMDGDANGNL